VAIAILRGGAVWCLATVGFLNAAGIRVHLANVGGVDVTLADLYFAAAIVANAIDAIAHPRPRARPVRFAQGATLLFIAWAGLTLLTPVDSTGPVTTAVISWARFTQTVALAVVAAWVIRSRRDVIIVVGGICAGGLIGVGSAIVDAAGDPSKITSADRIGGFLGVNQLALIAGIMLLVGLFAGLGTRRALKVLLIVFGIAGLLLGKSVATFVGVGIAIAIGVAFRRPADPVTRTMRSLAVGVAAAIAVFAVVQEVRPSASPGSTGYRDSSTAQRLILATAGIELFERHPLIGVGWRRSEEPGVIGASDIALDLRDRFQNARTDFFPDVAPASVHNSYIQVLAELGIVGFVLMVVLVGSLAAAIRRTLRALPRTHPLWAPAWALALSVLLAAVWLNDNPLYGGQIETVVTALMIGVLAGIARLEET
jgi:O-antigen ligase